MRAVKDITGQRFGRLVALKRTGATICKHIVWLCKCDCGNLTEVASHHLISRSSRGIKSCGCIRKDNGKRRRELHNRWKGDEAKFGTAHVILREIKPKPEFCERCKERSATQLSYNGENGEWSRNCDDYEWLCASCHKFKDIGSGVAITKTIINKIRKLYTAKMPSQRTLGKLFGIGPTTINSIINYKGIYKRDTKEEI